MRRFFFVNPSFVVQLRCFAFTPYDHTTTAMHDIEDTSPPFRVAIPEVKSIHLTLSSTYARRSASKAVLGGMQLSHFMRLARHSTALRAWCVKQCLPGWCKPDMLRPGIVGIRGSMAVRCRTMSTPPRPPPSPPLRCFYPFLYGIPPIYTEHKPCLLSIVGAASKSFRFSEKKMPYLFPRGFDTKNRGVPWNSCSKWCRLFREWFDTP